MQKRLDDLSWGIAIVAVMLLVPIALPELLKNLLSASGFIPHGHCYLWKPGLVSLHVAADSLIGLSYVSISATLAYLVHRARRDIPFDWMFLAFGLFIIACGATHFMEVWTLWTPAYWLSGSVKLLTAVASITTAVALPLLVPRVLALVEAAKTSQERKLKLETANQLLKQEIAERQRAEEELRDRVLKLRSYFELPLVGIAITSPDKGWLEVNDKLCEILGYSARELVTMSWASLTHPDDLAADVEQFNRVLAGVIEGYSIDKRFICKDGTCIHASIAAQCVRGADGSIDYFVAVVEDITQRKQAEEQIRTLNAELERRVIERTAQLEAANRSKDELLQREQAAQQYYRTLAEAIPQIVWTAREDGYLDYYNQRWFDYTGMTLEQTQGWGWQPVLHPDDRQKCVDCWAKAVETGESYQIEYRFKRASDGIYRWHLGRALPVRDSQGQIVKWFGTCTDIDAQKRAEADNARLYREAQEANRMKDEFLAILSHELRTPINAVLGWATMLRDRKFDEAKTAQALETIERNARLQTRLVEDLLDVSRMIQGKLELQVRQVDLSLVIKAAIATVLPTARKKSVEVKSIVNTEPGFVAGDSNRLQQVVWNLLSNAIKFTPSGGRVEVLLERVGDRAFLQVRDTGIGISPDFLPFVFDRFRQADSSITRSHSGLGLGLAIVRNLVELHGAAVSADSQGVGKGATFTVSLPLYKSREAGEISHFPNSQLPLTGLQVLVVDDEAGTREVITTVLKQHGAGVRAVVSVKEALEELERWQPDVLVSDLEMPMEDGYALIGKVRVKEAQGRKIRAIALSACAGQEDRQRAIAAGFHKHISKPVEPQQLVAAVTRLAGRLKKIY